MNINYKREFLFILKSSLVILIFFQIVWVATSYLLPVEPLRKFQNSSVVSSLSFNLGGFLYRYTPTKIANADKKDVSKLTGFNLRGVYLDPADKSYAVISYANALSIVSIGDRYRGYRLIDIFPDRVLFSRDSKVYEVKFLNKDKDLFSVKDTSSEDDGGAYTVNRREFNQALVNIKDTAKQIRVSQVKDGSILKGFKIDFIKEDSIFSDLGVKKGDVIVELNGIPVSDTKALSSIYSNTGSLEDVRLTVLRDGAEKQLNYKIVN